MLELLFLGHWVLLLLIHDIVSCEDAEDHIRDDLDGKTGVGTIGNYNTGLSTKMTFKTNLIQDTLDYSH